LKNAWREGGASKSGECMARRVDLPKIQGVTIKTWGVPYYKGQEPSWYLASRVFPAYRRRKKIVGETELSGRGKNAKDDVAGCRSQVRR